MMITSTIMGTIRFVPAISIVMIVKMIKVSTPITPLVIIMITSRISAAFPTGSSTLVPVAIITATTTTTVQHL